MAAAAAAHAAASCVALAWLSRNSRRAAVEQKIVWFNTLRVPFAANRIIRLGFRVLFFREWGCIDIDTSPDRTVATVRSNASES